MRKMLKKSSDRLLTSLCENSARQSLPRGRGSESASLATEIEAEPRARASGFRVFTQTPRRAVPLACLIAAAMLFAGCGKGTEKKEAGGEGQEAPTPVTVEPALRGAIDHVVTADAVLYPINQANVTPKISAPVKRMLVNRGDHVRAGQLLAELESGDLAGAAEESKHQYEQTQAAYQQNQAAYQALTSATVGEDKGKAESDLQAAQQNFEAAKKLYDNRVALQREGALPQKLVDDARVAMAQAQIQIDIAQRHLQVLSQVGQREAIRGAEAQVKGAEAQMNAAKSHSDTSVVQLSYAQIRSPIAGVIADRSVYAGEMAAGGTPLVSIVDISQLVARSNVPVKEATAIQVGRPARVTGPDGDLAGRVTVVSPSVDPNQRSPSLS